MTTDSNFDELSRLVKILGDKIDKLGNDGESRHDVIVRSTQTTRVNYSKFEQWVKTLACFTVRWFA